MTLENGYQMTTTFWEDFSIADHFGTSAIKDTYKRAFKEWKNNYIYLTELVIVLNYKIWAWYQKNEQIAKLYNDLWEEAREYALDNLKDEEFQFYWSMTD